MGGRLDSTNICNPVVTCITNIGYDHMQYLGESLEEIAAEKAGIIKEAIPLVVGRTQLETRPVFEKITTKKNSRLVYADQHFDLREVQTRGSKFLTFDVWKDSRMFLEKLDSPLLGKYQQENIATALQTIEVLNNETGLSIDEQTIREGIENVVQRTGLLGRWQILSTNPLTICDTGHNPEGMREIINQLSQTSYEDLHFVFGMVNDKDPENILSLLPKNATYYFSKPDIPRGLDAEILKEKAFKAGLRGESYNSVKHALNSATNNAKVNDLVFIGGSTFVVAEVV
jgi:dihydrofolate synthase/folylpolyglutamate synthase